MTLPTEINTAIQKSNVAPAWLVWVKPRNRTTNAIEQTGVSTLEQNQSFTIDGVNRSYYGAGSLLEISPFQYTTGAEINNQTIKLSGLDPTVIEMVRGYDARLAPAEIHLALLNPNTGALIGVTKFFDGFIDGIVISEADDSAIVIKLVSSMREGTKTLTHKKSDATLKLRNANDDGLKYADVSGSVKVHWGTDSSGDYRIRRNRNVL